MKLLGTKSQEYLKKLHKMIDVNSLSSFANFCLGNAKSWGKKLSKKSSWSDLVPFFPL